MAETTLRMGTWLPPTHVMNAKVLPTWGEWIAKATEGRVKLEIAYGLGHPKSMLDQVQDGAVDASWTYQGYMPGRFTLTQLPELPMSGADAETASVAAWRIHKKYFEKANEYGDVIVGGVFMHGPGQIHMREPIKSLDDLKGKKIRIGGGIQGSVGERLGVEGVQAPAPKVYEILAQGVADGVFMPTESLKSLRVKEVAPYTYKIPQSMYLGSFAMFINKDFMASLPKQDQDAIMNVSGEKFSQMAGAAWHQADVEGEADALANGSTITVADDAMQKAFVDAMQGMDEQWLELVSDRGIDAKAALDEYRSLVQSLKK
jgi:TRAP-type C4-dicarboxylate transport system substrate-binding protein